MRKMNRPTSSSVGPKNRRMSASSERPSSIGRGVDLDVLLLEQLPTARRRRRTPGSVVSNFSSPSLSSSVGESTGLLELALDDVALGVDLGDVARLDLVLEERERDLLAPAVVGDLRGDDEVEEQQAEDEPQQPAREAEPRPAAAGARPVALSPPSGPSRAPSTLQGCWSGFSGRSSRSGSSICWVQCRRSDIGPARPRRPVQPGARAADDRADMHFDFADLLLEVLERHASDLHITAGSHPMVRVRGRLVPLEDYPVLTPTDTREVIYSILTNDQRQRLETDWQLDFAYAIPGRRPLPRQRVLPARGDRRRVPPDPVRDQVDRRARPAGRPARLRPQARAASSSSPARPARASRRRSRRSSTRSTARARTTSSRSRTRSSSCTRTRSASSTSARSGSDAQSFAAALKAALRQDPDVILVGEMRDLETISHRADRGGDRPPRLRDAPHPGRAADDRPHHRRLPARAAAAGPRAALGRAAGRRHPAAAADRRRRRPHRRLRGAHPDPRGPQPDPRGQDPPDHSVDADRLAVGHADDGRRAGARSCARARSRRSSPSSAPRTPRSCGACMGAGADGGMSIEHVRLQGDRPHRPPGQGRGRRRVQAARRRPAQVSAG